MTSGTLFHSRKLAIRDYLMAIAIFANGAKGHSALQLSRDLDCQYKTAFVLAHKLREALGAEVHNPHQPELAGAVAVDGAYFGGKVKQANSKADRPDRRTAEEQTGKRQVVVVAREALGRTIPFIVPRESAAVPLIRQHVASGTVVHADESGAWDILHASYPMMRGNHSRECKSDDGACTIRRKAGSAAFGGRDGRPSSDQRTLSLSIRERNGMARRRAPGAERAAMAADHRIGPSPSEIGNLARILAAEGSMNVERPNTLAGLVEKRAEIAGKISHTRAALRQLIIDLDHVDAAIRIFDPSYDVEGIRQKIPSAAHRAIRGDMTRATLDALREASGPMTTIELARHVMAERGLNTADKALLQLFTRRTGALLRWQKKRGILRSVKDPMHGRLTYGKSQSSFHAVIWLNDCERATI